MPSEEQKEKHMYLRWRPEIKVAELKWILQRKKWKKKQNLDFEYLILIGFD